MKETLIYPASSKELFKILHNAADEGFTPTAIISYLFGSLKSAQKWCEVLQQQEQNLGSN